MVAGDAETDTEVMVGGAAVTVMVVEPDLVVSCVEVAVQVAVPTADGVRTPAEVMVALVADQVTAELYAPVPITCAVQVAVWARLMDAVEALTLTSAMMGLVFPLPPLGVPPPQPRAREVAARRPKARRRGWLTGTGENWCMNFPLGADFLTVRRASKDNYGDSGFARMTAVAASGAVMLNGPGVRLVAADLRDKDSMALGIPCLRGAIWGTRVKTPLRRRGRRPGAEARVIVWRFMLRLKPQPPTGEQRQVEWPKWDCMAGARAEAEADSFALLRNDKRKDGSGS